jgi:hypothetical protein
MDVIREEVDANDLDVDAMADRARAVRDHAHAIGDEVDST